MGDAKEFGRWRSQLTPFTQSNDLQFTQNFNWDTNKVRYAAKTLIRSYDH